MASNHDSKSWYRRVVCIALVAFCGLIPQRSVAAVVGEAVVAIESYVTGKGPLTSDAPIEVGFEIVVLPAGSVTILFIDESVLTLSPGSRAQIDEFQFGKGKTGQSVIRITKGTYQWNPGKILHAGGVQIVAVVEGPQSVGTGISGGAAGYRFETGQTGTSTALPAQTGGDVDTDETGADGSGGGTEASSTESDSDSFQMANALPNGGVETGEGSPNNWEPGPDDNGGGGPSIPGGPGGFGVPGEPEIFCGVPGVFPVDPSVFGDSMPSVQPGQIADVMPDGHLGSFTGTMTGRRMPLDMARGLSSAVARDVARSIPDGLGKGMSKNLGRNLSKTLGKNLSTLLSRDLSTSLSRDLSTSLSKDLSTSLSRDLSTSLSKDLSTSLSRDLGWKQ